MHIYELRREVEIPRPIDETFRFFENPHNLSLITPPWLNLAISPAKGIVMRKGAVIDYTLRWLGLSVKWSAEIAEYEPPFRFVDVQLRGPYRRWEHTHTFQVCGSGTRVTDVVRYAVPFGPLGRLAHRLILRRQLEAIFFYRQRALLEVLGASAARDPVGR